MTPDTDTQVVKSIIEDGLKGGGKIHKYLVREKIKNSILPSRLHIKSLTDEGEDPSDDGETNIYIGAENVFNDAWRGLKRFFYLDGEDYIYLRKIPHKTNVALIECEGKFGTIDEWAEIAGISPNTLVKRLKYGWTIKEAISRPLYPLKNSTSLLKRDVFLSLVPYHWVDWQQLQDVFCEKIDDETALLEYKARLDIEIRHQRQKHGRPPKRQSHEVQIRKGKEYFSRKVRDCLVRRSLIERDDKDSSKDGKRHRNLNPSIRRIKKE